MSPLVRAVVELSLNAGSFQQLAGRLLEAACGLSAMRAGAVVVRSQAVANRHLSEARVRTLLSQPFTEVVSPEEIALPLTLDGGQRGLLLLEQPIAPRPPEALEALRFVAATLSLTGRVGTNSLFNAGPVVVFRWRRAPGWAVEFVSDNVQTEFGWKAQDMVGAPYSPLVHPEDAERVDQEVTQAVDSGAPHLAQHYRLRHADGRYRWVFDATRPVRNGAGEVTHLDGYVIDDTPRVEAEAGRKALEAELRASQKLQAVGTLAGGIAHDFNNLLATIVAHAELARRRNEPSPDDLEAILEAASRGRDLVRQLLLFSRGGREEQEPLRVQAVVEQSLRLLRAALPASIRLERRLDGHAPPVRGNANQLQQVVLNLAMNAMRAMPSGGVLAVSVDTVVLGDKRPASALRPGVHVRVTVRDSGLGMPPDVVSRAFEPFFTTRTVGDGSGLGLSMVHGIIGAHGGAIAIESGTGERSFTEVTIWLPAASTLELPVEAPPQVTPVARKLKVAVVDDEEVLARATRRLLTGLGHEATTHDTSSVLKAFEANRAAFDLVISDFTMPGLNGVQFVGELRKLNVQVPVLIMTGHLSIDVPPDLDKVAVMNKPFNREDLVESIARLVR